MTSSVGDALLRRIADRPHTCDPAVCYPGHSRCAVMAARAILDKLAATEQA